MRITLQELINLILIEKSDSYNRCQPGEKFVNAPLLEKQTEINFDERDIEHDLNNSMGEIVHENVRK